MAKKRKTIFEFRIDFPEIYIPDDPVRAFLVEKKIKKLKEKRRKR